ncbi:hypothetical protein CWI66_06645 [Halomonas sp. 141]|uniref:hypothetical protein n=1 Tax=Halomonas sp. 141 TaxID=2056666 RepID=UPI000C2B505E|nr:hypothetical protein [Halomonas sp. 141]PJX14605.1 hypothetical protein CWI66_06645 [Halomonas sp. 141]
MTLDIRGGLKNTSISGNKYVVIEELLSNAIDSYLIRKNEDPDAPLMSIDFKIEFISASLFEDGGYDLSIACTDNGAGFGNDQVRAFVTKDSTYKDYLAIQGIGKCKGAGRIQYFHYFSRLKIASRYLSDDVCKKCLLDIQAGAREISESDFHASDSDSGILETTVSLQGMQEGAYRKHFDRKAIRVDFSAKFIRNYIFVAFLQRLIVLKNIVGDFSISVTEVDDKGSSTEQINSSEVPEPTSVSDFPLLCAHANGESAVDGTLKVTRYSLPESDLIQKQHEVALCANSALVYSLTKFYLKSPQDRARPIDGHFELLLVESDLLEEKVNEQRDGFNIPRECSASEDFDSAFSLQDIVESLEDYVFGILTPRDFDKDRLIDSTQERFGISRSMLNDMNIKVHYSDTSENIAKRVLKKYQEDIVKETSDIFDLKQELLELDPRSDDFRNRIGELSWKYTSTMKKMDMANLSQLVVRRSSMLEVLRRAVDSALSCQTNSSGRREPEKIIHNVFFPTGKDSGDGIDHDIWILNEEYHYFDHIASDKPLASIPWSGNQNLFDEDVDESLEALFAKNNKDHRLKRPDIAIFNQEGAAIIIEFKAPGVELQEHIQDLAQYSRLLAAKSGGKIKRFYGYLIGDCMDESRMPFNYTRFPSGLGYFATDRIVDQQTGTQYGQLYSEVLFYDQFIERASRRLKVFKEKLNMDV